MDHGWCRTLNHRALSYDGPTCLERERDPDECAESISNPAYGDVIRYLTTATQDFDNAVVVDMTNIICPDDRCAALSADGVVVFRDSQHVTSRFALSRTAMIRERLAVTRPD